MYQFPVPWRDSYYRLPGDETAQIRPLRDRIQWVITRDIETSPDPSVRDAYNEMIKDFELVDQQGAGRLFRRRVPGRSGGRIPPVAIAPRSALSVPGSIGLRVISPGSGRVASTVLP